MATNLKDRTISVFSLASLLCSWAAASIVSGSVIERMRFTALWLHAVMISSFWWISDAAWGWHYDGWMVKVLGYHDAYASGVIRAIAGGYGLGVLLSWGHGSGNLPPMARRAIFHHITHGC